jgi:hypothetical protein
MKTADAIRILIAGATLLLAGACHEIPQDARKSFAPRQETELYHSSRFNNSKATFDKALAARAQTQNEYLRVHEATPR